MSRVAVVGTGLIGMGWVAHFLARGMDVVATDPAPDAEDRLNAFLEGVWPTLAKLGLKDGAARNRVVFTRDLREAVSSVDFVQENGPERLQEKIELFRTIDDAASSDTLLASSSSGLAMTEIQSRCRRPARCLIGHPYNPPYLIPLVEVVGGKETSADAIDRALEFYRNCAKHPIHVKKEVPGHVANRLQAALWRETVHLVSENVVSIADVDAAVSFGPGLRWSLMGPNLTFHLGGGTGGIKHFLDHLSGPFEKFWEDLGAPTFTPEIKELIIKGVAQEVGEYGVEQLTQMRDEYLVDLIKLRRNRNPWESDVPGSLDTGQAQQRIAE